MKAKWLQNGSLDASGRPLGDESASGASPGAGAARGSQKISCSRPGGLLGWKVDRFEASGGSPGGSRRHPERLREAILDAFFSAGPCGTKKVRKFYIFNICGLPFFDVFESFSSSSRRRRRKRTP